ncbi:MAG: type II toxin-antitoxin system PemK/MazF family toxin [Candidatus Micrarchaeota archaeon]
MDIRRADIVLVNLDPVVGSEQGKTRPALVIQNDIGNQNSPTTIVAPITTKLYSKEYPTNVKVGKNESGLSEDSTILLNQIRTVDRSRIVRKLSSLRGEQMAKVELAIKASLGIE